MCDHKIIVLMGGKRGLDAQRQRLEGAHCISATCIQLNSCLWHLLPSGKYGIAILERFDIPGEPVKSGGKGTWVCPYIHCSMLPFVSASVNLLSALITFPIADAHTCFAIAYRHLHGWTSASCRFIFIVAHIVILMVARCPLEAVHHERSAGGTRAGRGSCHRPPSQQSGEGVLPFHNLPSVTLLLAVPTNPCASRPCPWAGVLAPLV